MAIVVLPLLPEGPFGPLGGIRPRGLWLLVLFFTGLSFAGYLSRRLFGAGRGYPIAGLLGGLVFSTNVTFTYARLSRHERGLAQPLAIGAIAACTMLFPRVMIAAAVLNLAVARLLLPYLAPPFLVGVACLVLWWRRSGGSATKPEQPSNPLQVIPALQMAMIFQIVLFTVAGIGRAFGGGGLRLAGAVLGLTDVDALTVAMTTTAVSSNAAEAAAAIATGILANCVMKALLAIGLGTRDFSRLTAAVLVVMAAAIIATIGRCGDRTHVRCHSIANWLSQPLIFSESQREHRARRTPHDLVRRRSEEHQVERVPSVHAHDDQIAAPFGRNAENFTVRLAVSRTRQWAAPRPDRIGHESFELYGEIVLELPAVFGNVDGPVRQGVVSRIEDVKNRQLSVTFLRQ